MNADTFNTVPRCVRLVCSPGCLRHVVDSKGAFCYNRVMRREMNRGKSRCQAWPLASVVTKFMLTQMLTQIETEGSGKTGVSSS